MSSIFACFGKNKKKKGKSEEEVAGSSKKGLILKLSDLSSGNENVKKFSNVLSNFDLKPEIVKAGERNFSFLVSDTAFKSSRIQNLLSGNEEETISFSDVSETESKETEKFQKSIPNPMTREYLSKFLKEIDGTDSKIEEFIEFPISTLISIILNHHKKKIMEKKISSKIELVLSKFIESNIEEEDVEITLKKVRRIRIIVSTYEIRYLNFFLVSVDGLSGIIQLRNILEKRIMRKMFNLMRIEKENSTKENEFRYFEYYVNFKELDIEYVTEIVLIFKNCLRNSVGYNEIINSNILEGLFFLLNFTIHDNTRKLNRFRIELLTFFSIVSICNIKGNDKLLKVMGSYERKYCREEENSFSKLVGILLSSKSQKLLFSYITFFNSLTSKSSSFKQRKKIVNNLISSKIEEVISRVKYEKIKNKNLKLQIDFFNNQISQIKNLDKFQEFVGNKILENFKNKYQLELLKEIVIDLSDAKSFNEKKETYKKVVKGEKLELVVEKELLVKEIQCDIVIEGKREDETIVIVDDDVKIEIEEEDSGEIPPPPGMDDEEDDEGGIPPPPGMDDDDEGGIPPPPGMDNDEGGIPPPPGMDDGVPPPPGMNVKKKDKYEISKIFRQHKKKKGKKVLHIKKIGKKEMKDSIFVKGNITKRAHSIYNEEFEKNFEDFMRKPEKKAKKKKVKKDEKKDLLEGKLSFKTSIVLKTIRIGVSKIIDHLINFDESVINEKIVDRLSSLIPSGYEKEMGKIRKYDGNLEDLTKSSQFFFQLSTIPHVKLILDCWNYKNQHSDTVKKIPQILKAYVDTSTVLKNDQNFHSFLQYCLVVCNLMSKREAVLGFKFKSLEQLIVTKSATGKSLLIFIISQCHNSGRVEILNWGKEIIEKLDVFLGYNLDMISDEIKQVRVNYQKLETCLKKTEVVKFKENMKDFREKLGKDLRKFNLMYEDVMKEITELSKLFGEGEQYIREDFFKDVQNFVLQIQNINLQYIKNKSKEEKKRLRAAKSKLMKEDVKSIDILSLQKKLNSAEIMNQQEKLGNEEIYNADSKSQVELERKEQEFIEKQLKENEVKFKEVLERKEELEKRDINEKTRV